MRHIQITMTLEVAESDPAAVWHAIESDLECGGYRLGLLRAKGWKIIEGSAREVSPKEKA